MKARFWLLAFAMVAPMLGQELYVDDFADGESSTWQSYVAGWTESGGVYRSTNTGASIPVEAVYSGGFEWGDYSAEVSVRADSFHSPSETGLLLRFNVRTQLPETSLAQCSFFMGSGGTVPGVQRYVRLFAQTGPTAQQSFALFPFSAGTWYRLRATAVGSKLTCEVVGHPETLVEIENAPVESTGTVGLRSTHIRSNFDDLAVTGAVQVDTPNGLRATLGDRLVQLRWQPSATESVDDYVVSIDDMSTGTPRSVVEVSSGCCSMSFHPFFDPSMEAVVNGVRYRARVRARVGTNVSPYSRELFFSPGTVSSEGKSAVAERNPLLFVHGFLGDGRRSFQDTIEYLVETLEWRAGVHLRHDGASVVPEGPLDPSADFFTVTLEPCLDLVGLELPSVCGVGDLATQGRQLSDVIGLLLLQGAPRLSIVAHSNGGLAAREYLNSYDPTALGIAELVTYGTPHFGADVEGLADRVSAVAWLACGLIWRSSSAADLCDTAIDLLALLLASQEAAEDANFACQDGLLVLSPFLESVNSRGLPGTLDRFVAIAGHDHTLLHRRDDCHSKHWDGLVPVTSAAWSSLGLPRGRARHIESSEFHLGQGNDAVSILCALSHNCLEAALFSPVEMEVVAPDGRRLARDRNEIPAAAFFEVEDDGGESHSRVVIALPLPGEYRVLLTPKDGVQPDETFSVVVTIDGVVVQEVENMRVEDIPQNGLLAEAPIFVRIDVMPGEGEDGTINLKQRGRIPVVLFGSPTLRAEDVSVEDLRFGTSGREAVPLKTRFSDLDGDGHVDLVVHFDPGATELDCGDGLARMSGRTILGSAIAGSDTVRVIGCS